MRRDVSDAKALAAAALQRAGVDAEHADTQATHLIDAELRGHPSHGLLRLPRIIARIRNGVSAPNETGTHTWVADALLQVDGQDGLGPVVGYRALDTLEQRVARTGIAAAVISRTNHLGMLAQYAERSAQHGWVAIALTTSEALVHPWGGRRALIGTNPVAAAVPALPKPFVLDMATGLISMGKVHAYAAAGRPLEPGWAVDAAGEPTTDAAAASTGAIAPFGGPKGYALGLAFELIVASLTDTALGTDVAGTLDDDRFATKGDVFILATPQPGTTERVSAYLDLLRAEKPQPGMPPVTIPGDRARSSHATRLADGIDVDDGLWEQLTHLAALPLTKGQSS
ncbi:Ldh family oxidoreductase [Microbacterium trichothecenolyticum]|uniref:Ldh family oxidoreductase n=1 Tax=Microbacterium ureisolvens TaxID=2781186 RepID=A0ABS7I5Y9_9MICO|nr:MULTISPECIES: Ldh family oxidoreductase [Microbacterium]MBW9111900.1 Ldh family oxidoreductase [Microbacterium ureisolvens]MBW9122253.1 Ldh family oxidoreductase [Microbacterium trichothecenolyticum]